MAYSTQADILLQLPEDTLIGLTDDARTGDVVAEVVTAAIADADAEIDGYVGARHVVPLDPVPGLVKRASVQLAIYNLYLRRAGAMPDEVQKSYDNQVRLLRDISKGAVSLGADDPGGAPPDSGRPLVSSSNPTRVLTRGGLKGM